MLLTRSWAILGRRATWPLRRRTWPGVASVPWVNGVAWEGLGVFDGFDSGMVEIGVDIIWTDGLVDGRWIVGLVERFFGFRYLPTVTDAYRRPVGAGAPGTAVWLPRGSGCCFHPWLSAPESFEAFRAGYWGRRC